MNVFIQIPRLNEADTLHNVISDLPDTLSGVDSVESLVIGDRRPWADLRQSWIKRKLQKLGSRFVSYLPGREIPDAVSGFRAMTREVALQTHIVTGFSYTTESVLQACSRGLAIEFVPITTNTVERPSRLFHSIPQFLARSGATMLRVFFMFRPLRVLMWLSVILGTFGLLPVLRFLYLYGRDGTAGHVQSLVLGGVLIILAGMALVAGLFADLIATNRRLAEMTLERAKRMECDAAAAKRLSGRNADSEFADPISLRAPDAAHQVEYDD